MSTEEDDNVVQFTNFTKLDIDHNGMLKSIAEDNTYDDVIVIGINEDGFVLHSSTTNVALLVHALEATKTSILFGE